jgi:tape measure domain-containing protein
MDLGALIAQLILDASNWTSGIDTALAGLDVLTDAAQAAGAAAAVGLSAAVVAGVDAASSFQQAAMSMEVLLGSADAADAMMKSIRDMAAVTPFDTQNLTEGAQMLMATGFAAEDTLPILTALGDAASSMPNGMNEKLPRMIQAFGKINGAGKVTLGAMNQFVKAGVKSFDMLAEKMGVSVAEVRSQISKGNVSSAVGLNALMEGINKKYGGMMAKQSQTLQGVMSTFMDSIKVPLSDMAKPLVDALSKAIPAITAILPGLLLGLKPLFDGLAKGAEAVGWLASQFGKLSAPMQIIVSYGVSGMMMFAVALGAVAVAASAVLPPILGIAGAVVSTIGAIGAGVVGLAGAFLPLLASMASFDVFAAAAAIDTALMGLSMLAAMVSAGTLGATMGALSVALVAAAGSALATAGSLFSAAVGALALDAAGGPLLIVMAALAATFVWLGIVVGTFAASMLSIATIITGTVIAAVVALYELWVNDFGGMQEVAGALWAVMGVGVAVVQGIGTAIADAATEWLTSMGVIGDSTGTTFGNIKESIVSGISSAVVAASGFIEDLRQSFLDMADSVILTLLRIAVVVGKMPGMEGAAAGGIAGLLQAQSGISQARGMTADLSGLQLKLPDLSGWVDEAKARLADYGKALKNMLNGQPPPGGGGSSSDAAKAAKDAAQAAKDYEEAHQAAIAAEMMLMGTGPAIQASMLRDSLTAMGEAVKDSAGTIDEMNKIYAEAAKALKEFRQGLLDTVFSAAGDVGSVIKSGLEGFATGGIKGALAAVAVQLLTLSPGFQKLSDGINKVLGDIMTSFDPLFNGAGMILIPAMQAVGAVFSSLAPIFTFIGDVLSQLGPTMVMVTVMMQIFGTIFEVFGSVLNAIGPIVEFAFQVLFVVMKGVAFVVLGIAYAIGSVWNGILNIIITVLEVISKVTNKVDSAIAALEDMKVDTAGTADAMQTLANTTYESAYETANASTQTAMMADAATEATAALSNVPSGFKVALNRFEAMAVESTAQSRAASSASSQRRGDGGITINIAAITAADPADLFDRLEKEANKRRYRKTGISIPTAPRFILGS